MKKLHITAKEWFDRVNGNSYFSAVMTIDGQRTITIPFMYGYGEQYLYECLHVLQTEGLIPSQIYGGLPRYCRENGIELHENIKRGCLKREVKMLIEFV